MTKKGAYRGTQPHWSLDGKKYANRDYTLGDTTESIYIRPTHLFLPYDRFLHHSHCHIDWPRPHCKTVPFKFTPFEGGFFHTLGMDG